MEKWTVSRSSVHVSSLFKLLPSHCLEYMTECLLKDHTLQRSIGSKDYLITEDMLDLLLLSPHMKVLDLSQDYLNTGHDLQRNVRIFCLASVRCLLSGTIDEIGYPQMPVLNRVYYSTSDNDIQLSTHIDSSNSDWFNCSPDIACPTEKQPLHSKNFPRVTQILEVQQTGVVDFWDTWIRPMPPQ
ncbi:hypothetical protein DAPPUDRAFT_336789, partial [Daphnia pulex]